jgi:uridine phosphorylase
MSQFPNFPGKHAHDAFFTPDDYVGYVRRLGRIDDYVPPDGIILCYQNSLLEKVQAREDLTSARRPGSFGRLLRLPSTGDRIGVMGSFGIGAPAAATALEELIALGTSRFIAVGTAGSLQHHCPVGHLVVCDRAIRDEGVSHHYLASETYATPSPAITRALRDELTARGIEHLVGPSWTIDTPYRETVEEARHYQREGVLCVEMEAAALFAVAGYRSVEICAGFAMSDSLADLVWNPQFHSDATGNALLSLFDAAVSVLAS